MSKPTWALKDAELELRASSAAEELAKHRWHWTLDESNPDRKSFRAYAKAVGRRHSVIAAMVNGYVAYLEESGGRGGTATLNEHIDRANVGAETELAADAVAERHGVGFRTATRKHSAEVRHVRERAREQAAKKGTTIEKEIKEVTKRLDEWEAVEAKNKARKAKDPAEYIEIQAALNYAAHRVNEAIRVARDHEEWSEDHKAIFDDRLAKLRAALDFLEAAIHDEYRGDWDKDLAAMTEGE